MGLDVLGPLRLSGDDGVEVRVSPRQAREVLTMLALAWPRSLSLDALATRLWDEPPPAAAKTIQGLLSRLRRALAEAGADGSGITGGPAGYRLADGGEVDVVEFHRLARTGRQLMVAGTWTLAVNDLEGARRLVRGAPELPATAAGNAQRAWLDELVDAVAEDRVEAAIEAGHVDEALADLELLTNERPLRERLWAFRMVAFARAGRTAEALRAYGEARAVLVEHAGLEPSDELRQVEQDILAGRAPQARAAGPSPPARAAARVGDQDLATAAVRYVAVDDVHIAYCTLGDAAADLVIMHGGALPVDAVLAEPRLAAAIEGLTSFARVTWFNHRGIGLSDRCSAAQLPTVQNWVCDLAAILDEIGATRPVVYACEDTTAVVLTLAAERPDRLAGIVLTNACARFTRADGYPHGLDPLLAEQSATETTNAQPAEGGFDLLTVIAPTVAGDTAFRAWWDEAGRRGATPHVARALRSRFHNSDIRTLVERVDVPVLHLVNPRAPAHDPGHDRYLAQHLPDVETVELPGPDELWWLDSGTLIAEVERFVRKRTSQAAVPRPR